MRNWDGIYGEGQRERLFKTAAIGSRFRPR
jgi:hypothetical protein